MKNDELEIPASEEETLLQKFPNIVLTVNYDPEGEFAGIVISYLKAASAKITPADVQAIFNLYAEPDMEPVINVERRLKVGWRRKP